MTCEEPSAAWRSKSALRLGFHANGSAPADAAALTPPLIEQPGDRAARDRRGRARSRSPRSPQRSRPGRTPRRRRARQKPPPRTGSSSIRAMLGWARANRGTLSRPRSGGSALRELLSEGHAARAAARASGSATRSTSAPTAALQRSLWFTLFDAEASGPRATKVTVGADAGERRRRRLHRDRRGPCSPTASPAAEAMTAELDASWDLQLRARPAGVSPPSRTRSSTRRAAAEDEAAVPVSGRPLQRLGDGRR